MTNCFHCGNDIVENEHILFNDKNFSLNTFRHAYADWSFKQNAKIRKQAAADMMHNKLSHIDY